jgi:hypothetical protein
MIRVMVGEPPPNGFTIIGPNCARTAAIWRAQDLQRGVDITQVQPPRY